MDGPCHGKISSKFRFATAQQHQGLIRSRLLAAVRLLCQHGCLLPQLLLQAVWLMVPHAHLMKMARIEGAAAALVTWRATLGHRLINGILS